MSRHWTKLRRTKLSRRSLLSASARAGVGAAGLALVGCGGDDDDDQQQQTVAQAQPEQQQEQQAMQQQEQQQAEQQQAQQQAMQQQQEQQAEQQAQQVEQQEQAQQEEELDRSTAQEEAEVSEVDLDAELIVGYGSFPPTLDITTAGGGGGQGASNNLHFAALAAYNSGRVIQAEGGFGDWEFTDDLGSFIWRIKEGVTFHNGEPLNAESVQFYWERILGRAEYNPDFESQLRARAGWMGDISVVDEQTVSIAMDTPFVDAPEQSGGINFGLLRRSLQAAMNSLRVMSTGRLVVRAARLSDSTIPTSTRCPLG